MTFFVVVGLVVMAFALAKFARVIWNPREIPDRSSSAPSERTGDSSGEVY